MISIWIWDGKANSFTYSYYFLQNKERIKWCEVHNLDQIFSLEKDRTNCSSRSQNAGLILSVWHNCKNSRDRERDCALDSWLTLRGSVGASLWFFRWGTLIGFKPEILISTVIVSSFWICFSSVCCSVVDDGIGEGWTASFGERSWRLLQSMASTTAEEEQEEEVERLWNHRTKPSIVKSETRRTLSFPSAQSNDTLSLMSPCLSLSLHLSESGLKIVWQYSGGYGFSPIA